MTFVTLENFNIHKVVLGDIYSGTRPVPYQVVPIQVLVFLYKRPSYKDSQPGVWWCIPK